LKFSILIANYNNGKYFSDCYDSIIAQTYKDWEAIIVDDKSTDNSIDLISSLIKDDQRFKLFRNEINKGCGFTKRRCAELATGGICCFLDPDDSITQDALEAMVDAHTKHPEVSLVHSKFYFCDEKLNRTSLHHLAGNVITDNRFTNLDAKVTPFAAFKSAAYEQTGGIDQNLLRAVDQDLYLKLSEKGPFFFINKALYNYRVHRGGIATANTDKAFYWYLKVIAKAEERRGVNLENELSDYLNRTAPGNLALNLSNPRYLLLALLKAFKKNPFLFFKRLFLNR
jgi:glycosyltransferase involved in cell wall biosynthesis